MVKCLLLAGFLRNPVVCPRLRFLMRLSFILAVERPLSPHTTFEELVAAQAQELEDAMITEVMAFYKTWSRKLEEIKKKSLRGCDLDDQKVDMKL